MLLAALLAVMSSCASMGTKPVKLATDLTFKPIKIVTDATIDIIENRPKRLFSGLSQKISFLSKRRADRSNFAN